MSSALFAKHAKKSVICHHFSPPGYVSKDCSQRRQGKKTDGDTSSTWSSRSTSIKKSNDSSGDKCKSRRRESADSAASHVGVCHKVSVGAKVTAANFFKRPDLSCASTERSSCSTGKRGTTIGSMKDDAIFSYDVVFTVSTGSGSWRLHLDFLLCTPGLPPSKV